MTAAVAALFADGPTTLRNIGSWRVKETDRIAAMATELRKLGATVDEGADWLRVTPPAALASATIDTYDDHRMAMCFSLVALGGVARSHQRSPLRAQDLPRIFCRTAPVSVMSAAGAVETRRAAAARLRAADAPLVVLCCRLRRPRNDFATGDRDRRPGGYRQRYRRQGRRGGPGLPLPRKRIALSTGRPRRAAQPASLDDEAALAAAAAGLDPSFDGGRLFASTGEDVTEALREEAVGAAASRVAVYPEVRLALVSRQRAFRKPPGLVAEGRDMGTVIFPDASLKVFVTASAGGTGRAPV